MGLIRIAFWNVENLFHWTAGHGRATGPKSVTEYIAKLDAVESVIRQFFPNELPDILGLAEIGSEDVVSDLHHRIADTHSPLWAGGREAGQSGLALFFRRTHFEAEERVVYPSREEIEKSVGFRPFFLVARLTDLGTGQPFLFYVNHWKSNRGDPAEIRGRRGRTARALGDFLDDADSESESPIPVVVMGDFNVNPWDDALTRGTAGLRGRRGYSTLPRWKSDMATFYNPCWRFLPVEDPFPGGIRPGYRQTRPQASLASGEQLYDQILFSKSFLTHPGISFMEESVRYFCGEANSRHAGGGRLLPIRWNWSEETRASTGVSDHLPIRAEFHLG